MTSIEGPGRLDQPSSADYTFSATVPRPFRQVVDEVRAAMADQGFGVLTEIDMAWTLRAKLGTEIPAQVILGMCRPELGLQLLRAEPSMAALLPCNVVVRELAKDLTSVEAMDTRAFAGLATTHDGRYVVAEAGRLVQAAMAALVAGTAVQPAG